MVTTAYSVKNETIKHACKRCGASVSLWLWNGWCCRAGHVPQELGWASLGRHQQLCRCPATCQRWGQAGGQWVLAWPITGVSPIWAGCVSLPAACSIFYWGKSCWYSAKDLPLFTGQGLCFIEATVRKQQLVLRGETEQKWWVVLNLALACRVCQEEGLQGLAVILSHFLEAWHCVNDWRRRYWLTPAVAILKNQASERALTAIYDPSKEDQNVIKKAPTTNQRKGKTGCPRGRQSLCTHLHPYSQTNTTIWLWLLDERVRSYAEFSFHYAEFLCSFQPRKFACCELSDLTR